MAHWIIDDHDDADTSISGLIQPAPGFFKIEDARRIVAVDDLLEACKALVEALIWTSGSRDFGPGGQAREGWERLARPALDAGEAAVRKAEGGRVLKG